MQGHHDDPGAVLNLSGVTLRKGDRLILDGIDWRVEPGQSWVVLGLNGSGKSSLLRVASLYEHPSTGSVEVLGERLGRTDVRTLRTRIGVAAASLADRFRADLLARDVVMTARYGALEPWWHTYTDEDRRRADALLERMGCGRFGDRTFASLSSGERQRVLLARTLMVDPGLVLLDEPMAGLDMAGREQLVATLDSLALASRARSDQTDGPVPGTGGPVDWAGAGTEQAPPVVLVTHHVEEVPPSFTHALLIRDGRILRSGPIEDVLDEGNLSECFGLPLVLERNDGRWSARAKA